MFSAQNTWDYLILFLLKAHTYNCWSTETKLLSFNRADHEILANCLVFNSVILVKFAERNKKTNASGTVSTETFTTWFTSFKSAFKNRQKSDISSGSRRKLQRLMPRITFLSLLLTDVQWSPVPVPVSHSLFTPLSCWFLLLGSDSVEKMCPSGCNTRHEGSEKLPCPVL